MYAEPFAPHTLASLGWRELNATLTRVRRTVQVTDGVRLSDEGRDHITACKISAPGNMSIRDGNISRLQMNDAMILLGQHALHNYLPTSVRPTCHLMSEQCRQSFLGGSCALLRRAWSYPQWVDQMLVGQEGHQSRGWTVQATPRSSSITAPCRARSEMGITKLQIQMRSANSCRAQLYRTHASIFDAQGLKRPRQQGHGSMLQMIRHVSCQDLS